MENPVGALRASVDRLHALASGLDDEQLVSPSYCDEWSIAQVLSHLGSQAEIFGAILDAALEERELPGPDAFPPVWDAWNSKSAVDQVVDSVAANALYVSAQPSQATISSSRSRG